MIIGVWFPFPYLNPHVFFFSLYFFPLFFRGGEMRQWPDGAELQVLSHHNRLTHDMHQIWYQIHRSLDLNNNPSSVFGGKVGHHITVLVSLLSLIRISALMLQNLLAFFHTFFINVPILYHSSKSIQQCCMKHCALQQAFPHHNLLEFLLEEKNAQTSAFIWHGVCVSCSPWPGEELAWAGTSFPAGYLRDRGRTGAPGLPQPHPSSAFSWGLVGTSSCSIPTAFTAFTTLLMSWAAFEKPPYTISTCERLHSLLSHAWKGQQRFPHSLQREWHRRVDVPTNFRGSAEETDTCTRFYAPQTGSEMNEPTVKVQHRRRCCKLEETQWCSFNH